MKKNTYTLRGGVVRAALALALALGLMPAQALSSIAVADEGDAQTQDAPAAPEILTDTVQVGESGQTSAAEEPASAAEPVAAEAAVEQSNSAPEPAAATDAADGSAAGAADADIVSASVHLASQATVVAYNGLSFELNETDQTATLTGISNTKLQGQLSIPAEITTAGTTYQVTNIRSNKLLWGGVHR